MSGEKIERTAPCCPPRATGRRLAIGIVWLLAVLGLFIFLIGCRYPDEKTATILYFNDAHQIDPVVDDLGQRGGVARLTTVVRGVRSRDPATFVVLGGDLGGGRLFGGLFHGFPMVEAFNALPLDLASFGQHDFDFGSETTAELVAASEFPWITTNLESIDGGSFAGLAGSLVTEIGPFRVGFLGLTDAMETTLQDGRVVQRDLVEAARREVDRLHPAGLDALIAITQTGLETNERLLIEVPEIAAVLTEERREDRSVVEFVGSRPIAAPAGNMGSIIQLDLRRRDDLVGIDLTVLAVDHTVARDPELAAIEDRWMAELESRLAIPVAPLDVDLEVDGSRWRETALGNVVTDAYRLSLEAEVGWVNGGGLRAGLAAGELTFGEVMAVVPFGNRVCLVRLAGSYLLAAVEHGLGAVERSAGAFLQVSGMEYEYDWSRPPGSRLLAARVGGRPVDPDRLYRVALPNHLLLGGDGFEMLRAAEVVIGPAAAAIDAEVMAAYLEGLAAAGPVAPRVEGRIVVHGRE